MRALLLTLGLLFATPAFASGPVVVELYTSQGCEDCWRANVEIANLAGREDVLPLTLPVDYWDYLGWADTFARPEFAERQREHARALKLRGLQTPLVVVDGAAYTSGLQRGRVAGLIRARRSAAPVRPEARFAANGRRVLVTRGGAPEGGAEVWLVRYDPRLVNVAVTSGPNRGRSVPHRNVVRELAPLGAWTGAGRSYSLPEFEADGLKRAVLVQARRDGRVLAAVVDD